MARTTDTAIIAAFRNNTDAEAASRDLEAAGISRSNIDIENGSGTISSSDTKTTPRESGIARWFKSIFSSDDDTDRVYYERAIKEGATLLRVDVEKNDISTIEDILNRHSPIDICSEEKIGTETAASQGQATAKNTKTRSAGQTKAVPVVKEDIQVGKRQVLRGGVRIYSRVVEEPVEEKIRLREEHVRVERQPVNRAATDADLAAGKEQVIEVQEFAEEPVVGKQARVVEEVRVGKDVSEHTETVRDSVRHTDVDVEHTGGVRGTEGAIDDSDFRADFQNRYATSGASYDTYLPAYRYGYEMASDPLYSGRPFDDVESDLRKDYAHRYPNSAWDRMKDAIRYGWNKVTGKAKAAGR